MLQILRQVDIFFQLYHYLCYNHYYHHYRHDCYYLLRCPWNVANITASWHLVSIIQAATPWSGWMGQNKYKLGANDLIDEGHKLKMMSKMQKCKTPRDFSDVIFGGNLAGLSLSSWPFAKDSCKSDSALFSDGMMSSVTIFPHGSAFSI